MTAGTGQKDAECRPLIVRLDKRLDAVVPRDAKLEKVADGFAWLEGPVWNRKEQYLLFSDVPNNSIFKWTRADGISLFMKPSGLLQRVPRGRLPGNG